VEIHVPRGGSCAPIYTRGALVSLGWLGAGALALSLWGAGRRGAFLSLGQLGRRLVPREAGGGTQEASAAQLRQILDQRLQPGHRAVAFLGWWVRHPVASVTGRGAYSETIKLSFGRSSHDIAVSLLDGATPFRALERDPGPVLGSLVARATASGPDRLYACLDAEGRLGCWWLDQSRDTAQPGLHALSSGDSLLPIDELDGLGEPDSHESGNPVEPARWEIQPAKEGR